MLESSFGDEGLVVADNSHHKSHSSELHHDGALLSMAHEWIARGQAKD
jgi:hypothetical protein